MHNKITVIDWIHEIAILEWRKFHIDALTLWSLGDVALILQVLYRIVAWPLTVKLL